MYFALEYQWCLVAWQNILDVWCDESTYTKITMETVFSWHHKHPCTLKLYYPFDHRGL
jgi:hypothetical protein